jgi:hypothetical protein
MHESAFIFVPAATFGQIIPKCDTAPQVLQLLKSELKKIRLATAGD